MSTLNSLSIQLSQHIHKCDRYDYFYYKDNTFTYKNIPDELFNEIINHLKDNNGCKSFDDVDDLIDIFNYIFYSENFEKLYDLLVHSGNKFLTTISNNSERTPNILYLLKQKQQTKIYDYIKEFVQPSKLATWEERYNKIPFAPPPPSPTPKKVSKLSKCKSICERWIRSLCS